MIHYYSNKGFVLIIILLFLQLFSTLGLYGLAVTTHSFKLIQVHWEQQMLKINALQLMRDLEDSLLSKEPHCQIPHLPVSELTKKSISWWQQHACSGNLAGFRYYYVTETLGQDACSVIKADNEQTLIADYYRITLLALSLKMQQLKLILQSTVAKANPNVLPCQNEKHWVMAGHQMLREW